MSYGSKLEPKFNDEVALDEYALVSLEKQFDLALQFLGEYDFRQCMQRLDEAWALSVKVIRKKVGNRPSVSIKTQSQSLPSISWLMNHQRDWRTKVPFFDYERACEVHGSQFTPEEIWAVAYLEIMESNIIETALFDLQTEVNGTLEDLGLWIGKRMRGVTNTAERPLEVQPVNKKVEATYAR